MAKMQLHSSLPRRRDPAPAFEAVPKFQSIVDQITHRSGGFFRLFVDALKESRRREAAALIRQYRHLIDSQEK
jgi:hypothetical protein